MNLQDDQTFWKKRRNFMAVSLALLFVQLADVEVGRTMQLANVNVSIGKPEIALCALWAAWFYFVGATFRSSRLRKVGKRPPLVIRID